MVRDRTDDVLQPCHRGDARIGETETRQVVQQPLRLMTVPPDLEVPPQTMASKSAPAERESF